MSFIHILDESTINQIAAGEVVERPSAVVKELIENAMDAGATAITAEIKEGGLSFIRITDNGGGIAREDIPMTFLRHATSKIRTAQDLLRVTSLGFRGEALSSIASVAQVEMITKTPEALNGYRYMIEGGEEKSVEEIGCPGGTTIIVRNLFYNTPARRKFLKSAMTEAGYISDLMVRLMISHPDISFKFIMNNQVKLQSSGNNNTKDILYQVYGRGILGELLEIDTSFEELKLSGYIGKPVITRGNRNFENYFINGRYIKNGVITKAIEEAYKPFLMQHKYPFTSLYFEINPAMIDVNVHPQKLEIRIKNAEEIYRLTCHILRNALAGKELIPKVSLTKQEEKRELFTKQPEPFELERRKLQQFGNTAGLVYGEKKNAAADRAAEQSEHYSVKEKAHSPQAGLKALQILSDTLSAGTEEKQPENQIMGQELRKEDREQGRINGIAPNVVGEDRKKADSDKKESSFTEMGERKQLELFDEAAAKEEDTPFLSRNALKEHRIIGQIFATYWLVEYRKELYIIDQHAAHEKVLYERIMKGAKEKSFASQQLLPPIVLTLSIGEQEVLHKQEELLKAMGYEFENFGGNEYSFHAVPADVYSITEKELLLEFIDNLAGEAAAGMTDADSVMRRIASLSCKAAVKANHTFSYEEASALINELLTLENPYHCPHGRPVIIAISQYELERKFKRII